MLFQHQIDTTDSWLGLEKAFEEALAHIPSPRRVLIIPPDITRLSSGAGRLAQVAYRVWGARVAALLPATGSHRPMSNRQLRQMFGIIPQKLFLTHHWQRNLQEVGTLSADWIHSQSGGRLTQPCRVALNKAILDGGWDCILSIGQVTPHEVAGFSNYSKNIIIGTGGREFIEASHYLSALCGIENILGTLDNPVRKLIDHALARLAPQLPLLYALTVTQPDNNGTPIPAGLYVGDTRRCFEEAAHHSKAININQLATPLKRAVVYLNPQEYRSLWLANKAIYRLRMALAPGGELIIIAPGVAHYAEDSTRNNLIGRYGYRGIDSIQEAVRHGELTPHLATAAHLMHGSSEGRFRVIYCTTKLSATHIRRVGYEWGNIARMRTRYLASAPQPGINHDNQGEEFYFVTHPGAGLWQTATGR